jgi:hypothetical protein
MPPETPLFSLYFGNRNRSFRLASRGPSGPFVLFRPFSTKARQALRPKPSRPVTLWVGNFQGRRPSRDQDRERQKPLRTLAENTGPNEGRPPSYRPGLFGQQHKRRRRAAHCAERSKTFAMAIEHSIGAKGRSPSYAEVATPPAKAVGSNRGAYHLAASGAGGSHTESAMPISATNTISYGRCRSKRRLRAC